MKKLEFKGNLADLISYFFQTLLVTYLVALLIEQIWNGFVSTYFNLNYLLVTVIVIGIFDVFSEHPEKKSEKIKARDYIFISILGIVGFAIIRYKTVELGNLSWIISVIAGVLIILLSILVLSEDEEPEKTEKTKKKSEKEIRLFWVVGVLLAIIGFNMLAVGLAGFTDLSYLEALRIVFGSVYVLFLPGFFVSYIFFPKTEEIDWIERIALSFALSIAVVPLVVFYLNLVGIKINVVNSSLIIAGIIVLSLMVVYFRKKK